MLSTTLLWLGAALVQSGQSAESRQATGVKVGEVTQTSAIVWMRVTAKASRNAEGIVLKGRATALPPPDLNVDELIHACPGAAGRARLRYGTNQDLSDAVVTPWAAVQGEDDFTHQFRLEKLRPGTVYYFSAETAEPGQGPQHGALRGRFETAPPDDVYADVTFTVITGQAYRDVDHPDGFNIYPAMGQLKPKFIVPTGDTVYYDNDKPLANTVALARYHWHRMYGFPRLIDFHLRVPGYWEKDDHDTFFNDCWPGMRPKQLDGAPLTFEKGLRIFREQVPMGEKTYRTVRWGRGLQVWMVEGRDFRSPNTMPDGPDKTIWGAGQKRWLKETILASDADWKVLISPTPIVGSDRAGKSDNHSNKAFAHEGNEIRQWIAKHAKDNLFVACGDRHWQYYSVDPKTGVEEFCSGAASDQHAGGTPEDRKQLYNFLRIKGGFLSVTARREGSQSIITFRHHDVHGKVVHEVTRARPVR